MKGEQDPRQVLDVLKSELDFLEKGGYHPSVHDPGKLTSLFQDSPTCLCYPDRQHEDTCLLMNFVPPEHRAEAVPCHFIPLTGAGETVEALEQRGDQQDLEATVLSWLRNAISRLEEKTTKPK